MAFPSAFPSLGISLFISTALYVRLFAPFAFSGGFFYGVLFTTALPALCVAVAYANRFRSAVQTYVLQGFAVTFFTVCVLVSLFQYSFSLANLSVFALFFALLMFGVYAKFQK